MKNLKEFIKLVEKNRFEHYDDDFDYELEEQLLDSYEYEEYRKLPTAAQKRAYLRYKAETRAKALPVTESKRYGKVSIASPATPTLDIAKAQFDIVVSAYAENRGTTPYEFRDSLFGTFAIFGFNEALSNYVNIIPPEYEVIKIGTPIGDFTDLKASNTVVFQKRTNPNAIGENIGYGVEISCNQVAYTQLLKMLGNSSFVISGLRYNLQGVNYQLQYSNDIKVFQRTLFGAKKEDTITPAAYFNPSQYQSTILDIPAKIEMNPFTTLITKIYFPPTTIDPRQGRTTLATLTISVFVSKF